MNQNYEERKPINCVSSASVQLLPQEREIICQAALLEGRIGISAFLRKAALEKAREVINGSKFSSIPPAGQGGMCSPGWMA